MSVKKYPLVRGSYGLATVTDDDGILEVIYRGTRIVTFDKEARTAILRNGGWFTPTTKNGINCFLDQTDDYPRKMRQVYYKKGDWGYSEGSYVDGQWVTTLDIPFEEGMKIEL